ncbi:MAG: DUF1343 domain-containing protein [Acidimicrobiales bacterium]
MTSRTVRPRWSLVLAGVVVTTSCSSLAVSTPAPPAAPPTAAPTTAVAPTAPPTTASDANELVSVGAAELAASGFAVLDGRRVGLIANQTSVVGDRHLADLLSEAPNVTLGAIFAPEHGFRGTDDAGEGVADDIDPRTGATVYSLYGNAKQPTPAMLAGLDALVYDIQDVGTRFYTYISTMGLAMQAAADAGIAFVVLDRPNPNPGPSAGFVRQADQQSFIGQYPLPASYGLTPGELALAIKGEAWLSGLESLDLTVVPMTGWRPSMYWGARPWIAPSPGLPNPVGARLYPGTVLFEATSLSWGRGTDAPFEQVGAPWLDATTIAAELNLSTATTPQLGGVHFEATTFTPQRLDYMTADPQFANVTVPAVRIAIDDEAAFEPVAVGVYLLASVIAHADGQTVIVAEATFDLLAGSRELRTSLTEGVPAADIVASWATETTAFDQAMRPYRLYGD